MAQVKFSGPIRSDEGFNVVGTRVSDTVQYTRLAPDHDPATSKKAGGAAGGATGNENVMIFANDHLEYHILGTQTITAPSITSTGLNIGMDQTNNDGVEVSQGILSNSKHAYTVGTSEAFYFAVEFAIADVSGTDDCAVGFRKAEAYQANIDDYDELACLNVISGNINIETILNGAATTTTDTTDNWADGETHTLKVIVDKGGAVSYQIDAAAPTTTATFSFDSGEVVVPFLYFLNAVDVAGAVNIITWECAPLSIA
ncbi:MAG: hypothetical protein ACE5DX_05450 [Candidatus Dojkabacteria bacterium]